MTCEQAMSLWGKAPDQADPDAETTRAAHAALQQWLREPPGSLLAEAEAAVYEAIVPDLFGYHLLQIGALGDVDLTASSRIHHRMTLDVAGQAPGSEGLRSEADALPFAADSIDVVLLPHVLEFEPRPHDALRESFRVLAPEGHLLVSIFNPASALGLWRVLRRHRRRAPWNGQFLTPSRLRDWLALLGFDVIAVHGRFFAPPFRNAVVLRRMLGADPHMARVCPVLAGTHIMLARKRVFTLTPIRPRWASRKGLVAGGLAEPTAREITSE